MKALGYFTKPDSYNFKEKNIDGRKDVKINTVLIDSGD
jgi:hypothetical protein